MVRTAGLGCDRGRMRIGVCEYVCVFTQDKECES